MNERASQEREKAVAAVMRHMLFKNAKQPGVPATRDELVGIVMAVITGGGGQPSGNNRKSALITSGVIEEAKSKFPSLLGFEMKELQRVARGKGTALSQGEMEILLPALMSHQATTGTREGVTEWYAVAISLDSLSALWMLL